LGLQVRGMPERLRQTSPDTPKPELGYQLSRLAGQLLQAHIRPPCPLRLLPQTIQLRAPGEGLYAHGSLVFESTPLSICLRPSSTEGWLWLTQATRRAYPLLILGLGGPRISGLGGPESRRWRNNLYGGRC